jgi:Mn-dependent DtxR family transcriptional regulator
MVDKAMTHVGYRRVRKKGKTDLTVEGAHYRFSLLRYHYFRARRLTSFLFRWVGRFNK